MLIEKTLDFAFVDNDTGEVISKHHYHVFNNEDKFDTQDFLSDKVLASFVASFKRGCLKRENLSLQIDFKTNSVF